MISIRFVRLLWLFSPFAFFISSYNALSQNVLTDLDHDAHQLYNRMIILSGGGPANLHSSLLPYLRDDVVRLADQFWYASARDEDRHDVQSVWDQNNEFIQDSAQMIDAMTGSAIDRYRFSRKSLWNTFYKTPAHAYEVDVTDFYLRVNPVLHVAAGRESVEGINTFINQRGLSLRGGIGKNVFFQTKIYDSQVRFANYVNRFTDQFQVVPGAGLYKDFSSSLFDFTKGRDYLLTNAYLGVNLGKYIGFQLGHNQFFIGDGIRSMLLSDFSTPFFSLKINTRIWKFHYQNIFAEMAADNFSGGSGTADPIPKKYMAAHYLSYKPSPFVTIGLFEAVVFNREGHRFELQYLNPVILYRTIEGTIGSPDNVLLGLNARVDLYRSLSLYGQFMLDDVSFSHIFDGHLDWWGNKFAYQMGGKYINAFNFDGLDLQAEWNAARPYVYSHYDENANYSNYRQPIAHPLGANFNEIILSATYAFSPKLRGSTALYIIRKGEDQNDSISYGGNVILPNTSRPDDFNHKIGQGITTDIIFWNTRLSYELSSGLFLEGRVAIRNKESGDVSRNVQTRLFQFGVRYNMMRRDDVF